MLPRNYVQTYTERHGHIQILGMPNSIPLDDIYTDAWMMETKAIKSYFSQADLEKIYRNSGHRDYRGYTSPKISGIEIAKENDRLIVLGEPGIGKSTFLRKVGLEALKGKLGNYQLPYIPIFLELKRFRSPEVDLKASIVLEFEGCGISNPKGFTENALKQGQLLLLFDGLDEVITVNRNAVIEGIQDLVDRYSGNRFIASCRTAAYHTYFKRVSTVTINAFDDDQIFHFIKNWFQTNPNSQLNSEQKAVYANTIWEQLKTSDSIGIKELSKIPLLLTFFCLVFQQQNSINISKTKLFSKVLDILLEEWSTEKRVWKGKIFEEFSLDLEKGLLAVIAYEGFINDKLFFSKEQILKIIDNFLNDIPGIPKNLYPSYIFEAIEVQQGILVEQAEDIYSFSNSTLQNFLAAKYIVALSLQEDMIGLFVQSYYYKEILFFVVELMGKASIEIFKKLEARAQVLSEYPSLKALLTWSEAKTQFSTQVFSRETKCILALFFALNTSNLIKYILLEIYTAIFKDLANKPHIILEYLSSEIIYFDIFSYKDFYSYGLGNNSKSSLENAFNHTKSLFITFKIFISLNANLNSNLVTNLNDANELIIYELILAHSKIYSDNEIITGVDFQLLNFFLSCISDLNNWILKDFFDQISAYLDIEMSILCLSDDDVNVIIEYLSVNQLMIDCSKQATALSEKDWEAIQQRMFLPPQS